MTTLKKGYFITSICPKEYLEVDEEESLQKLSIRWRVCLECIIVFLAHSTLTNGTSLYPTTGKKIHLPMLSLIASGLVSLFLIMQ